MTLVTSETGGGAWVTDLTLAFFETALAEAEPTVSGREQAVEFENIPE